jgi:hypothetical protein
MEEEKQKISNCPKCGAFGRQSNLSSPVDTAAVTKLTTAQLTEINSENPPFCIELHHTLTQISPAEGKGSLESIMDCLIHVYIYIHMWHAVAQLVEALRYKPERRGFIPDGVTGFFH